MGYLVKAASLIYPSPRFLYYTISIRLLESQASIQKLVEVQGLYNLWKAMASATCGSTRFV